LPNYWIVVGKHTAEYYNVLGGWYGFHPFTAISGRTAHQVAISLD